jgi:redox-sensitive bicupin YhaK (pirin superfamily)
VLHRDSLGSRTLIRPGELNLMTSGRGIVHAEESPRGRPATLHGLQLWIALPAGDRFTEPSFAHHAVLPVVEETGATVTVAVGVYRGEQSPAQVFTPLAGFEVNVQAGASFTLTTRPDFEYAVVAVDGPATVAGAHVEPGLLAHLPSGVTGVRLEPESGQGRFFVIGGEPFTERLVMWWNFVARTSEEITQAREDWATGRFATVRGYAGDPLPAPALPAGRLRPR